MSNIWIFSNKAEGYYEDSDWDTTTILKTKKYYFKTSEPNRSKIKKDDNVLFREYGIGFWGHCIIVSDWVDDKDAKSKYQIEAGWFLIDKIKKWNTTLPYEVIRSELSNQNYRLRIAKATSGDKYNIELALKIYKNLGYGSADGSFFVLESGIEEAIKANISQLSLTLSDEDIQQQCNLGIGI